VSRKSEPTPKNLKITTTDMHGVSKISHTHTLASAFCLGHQCNISQKSVVSFDFTSAVDRASGLRALAEVVLVPAGGDVRLGAADWALETANVTASLSDERCPA